MAELGSAQGWVTTGTATIAAIAGIVSGINSDQAKTRAAAAEAQSRATSAQLAQQAEARQLSSANRDYQLAVTRMVLDAIGKDDRRLQGALVGLVATLPEESLAKSLTEALASSGDAAVAGRANANLSALESYVGQNESDGREVLAGPTIAPTRLGTASATRTIAADASPVGTTRQLTPKKAGAWDVDIFWCQGMATRRGACGRRRWRGRCAGRRALRWGACASGRCPTSPTAAPVIACRRT